jgi:type III secretion protein V
VALLAVVPGLPTVPFLVIGALLLVSGAARARAKVAEQQRATTESPRPERLRSGVREPAFVPLVVPWSLEVGAELEPAVDAADGIRSMALGMREQVFADLGVPLPPPRVRVRPDIEARSVVLSLHEVPARVLRVPDTIAAAEVAGWVRGPTLELLRARAVDFLGLAEVQRLLDELESFAPATVRNVVPKPVSLVLLTDVLRRLVEERFSIRDLRGILESLSMVAATEKDALNLAEYARSQARRAITYQLTGGGAQLDVVLLDPILEETLRRAITRTPAGAFLTLAPHAARDVVAALRKAIDVGVGENAGTGATENGTRPSRPVILTQPDIRRFVRKLLESELPDVTVVSFAELLPEVALKPVGRAVAGAA